MPLKGRIENGRIRKNIYYVAEENAIQQQLPRASLKEAETAFWSGGEERDQEQSINTGMLELGQEERIRFQRRGCHLRFQSGMRPEGRSPT